MDPDSVNSVSKSLKRFGLADYVVFALMLVICTIVGVYFGYKDHKKRQKNKLKQRRGSEELDYLMGGRNLSIFPVAMSLVASGLSGATLLGMPTEVYKHGINIIYFIPMLIPMGIFVHYVIIPVFHNLQIVSTYEYLKQRFDERVRLFGSVLFLWQLILYLPVVIYGPALTFNHTTGVNVHVISVFVCLICIFYTLLGGIKAVVWTDVIQVLMMFGALAIIVTNGVMDIGSLSLVYEKNANSTRMDFPEFTWSFTERHSVMGLIIGGTTFLINLLGIGQAMVQRYMSLPTIQAARSALRWNILGITVMVSMCCLIGMILYAKFENCDPLATKSVAADDQLVPLLVMQNLGHIPGFAGIFAAGIFSASLSTLSTALNAAAAVVLEDFWKPNTKSELSSNKTSLIMRATVFILGIISVALVNVVERLGGVLQLAMSVQNATTGPLSGLFFMAFFLPWIKAKGALIGSIVSITASMYVVLRAQHALSSGEIFTEMKPTSIEGCEFDTSFVNSSKHTEFEGEIFFPIHHMSYLYYSVFGTVINIVVAFIVTLIDGDTDPSTVDPRFLAPFVAKHFMKNKKTDVPMTVMKHVFDINGENVIREEIKECER